MSSDIAPRLARNSALYAMKSVVALAAMLLVTPVIIGTVGTDQYGIWALAGVLTSYTQLSDFGITESLVKYAAEYHARRETDQLNRLVNTALVQLLCLALLIGSALYLLMPSVTELLLKVPPRFQEEAVLIFRLSIGIFLCNLVFGVFNSLVISTQSIGYTSAINITSTIIGVIGTLGFLHAGWGLLGLVATNGIVAVVTGGLNMLVARRLFPELRIGFVRWTDRLMMRQIFSFSWKIQASNLSQLMIFQIDRILLSRYLGLEAVAFYEIGSNAAFYAKSFLSVLFAPMVPAASALQATNDHVLIGGLYKRSFKFMVLLAVPFTLLVMAAAGPFIRIWMGSGFALSALTLQLLMPAYLINILTGPGTFILNGINRPDIGMRAAFTAGASNLVLCLVLVLTCGYFGLIIGISTSLAVSAAYFFSLFHRTLPEIGWGVYRRTLVKPFVIAVPAAITLFFLDRTGWIPHLPALLAGAAGYAAVVGFLLLRCGYLDDFERRIFYGLLPFNMEGR